MLNRPERIAFKSWSFAQAARPSNVLADDPANFARVIPSLPTTGYVRPHAVSWTRPASHRAAAADYMVAPWSPELGAQRTAFLDVMLGRILCTGVIAAQSARRASTEVSLRVYTAASGTPMTGPS